MPISIQDLNGHEMTRVYTDQFGTYNFIAPSTFTVNAPIPTGVSPNMIRLCLNHPGPIPDPARPGRTITDPFFDRRFALTCYTLDFWPAKTTYLDTPVIPVAAYTSVFDASLDCEFPDGTPVISDVTGSQNSGPYVSATGSQLSIKSAGFVEVLNPDCNSRFDPTCAPLVTRDFGFGHTAGTVKIGDVELTNVAWANNTITATVPAGAATGQLSITRGDNGQSSITGVTVTVGPLAPGQTVRTVTEGQSIQAAIDAAASGDLIIVRPGNYDENIIMSKNVKLQGSGAYSTSLNAAPTSPENLQNFRQRVQDLLNVNAVSLIPGESLDLHVEFAAVTVIANDGVFTADPHGRIDGFTITSATSGGGITVNGYAHFLEISNNRIVNNAGSWGGGIRVGTPGLTDPTGATDPTCGPASATYCSNRNDNITVHNNHIFENGSVGATTGGGGIALFNGADNYRITDNYVCGNFTTNRGAGIAHVGLSPNGLIERNKILLNESSFNSLTGGEGGGIILQGEAARTPNALLTPGTGSVVVNANLIQANMAGNGKGGGIYVSFPNGLDVDANPGNSVNWYGIDIFNNIIANNVAGWMGGGIFLQDAAKARIDHNTIVNNSSTSSGANALLGVAINQPTIPQGAGVVSGIHSLGLANALAVPDPNVPGITYSNPELINNIIWHNSSYSYDPTVNPPFGALVPHPATYWDLQVFAAVDPAQVLDPNDTILSSLTGPDGVDYTVGGTDLTNQAADPLFITDFVYTLRTAAAPGEGGNTVQVSILPIKPAGDYHLRTGSPAIDQAAATAIPQLVLDYDGETRPDTTALLGDIGADEFSVQPVSPAQVIRLVTPNGGEIVPTGQPFAIQWQASATFPPTVTYRLQVSYDSGATWETITGAEALATTSFSWTVPPKNANKKKSLIRVQAFDGGAKTGEDVSDDVFVVEVLKIVYPSDATVVFNEGVTIAPPFGINWRLNDVKKTVAKARIEVSKDNGATWQKADLSPDANAILNPAEGVEHQQTWTVPNVNKVKTKAKVRITLLDNAGNVITQDQNDEFFTIAPVQ
jgi:hypothetical protein